MTARKTAPKKKLCPCCEKMQPPEHFGCVITAKAGRAGTGKSKARDPEKMRAAVNKRWAKVRAAKG